jgi:hypothetical protein
VPRSGLRVHSRACAGDSADWCSRPAL